MRVLLTAGEEVHNPSFDGLIEKEEQKGNEQNSCQEEQEIHEVSEEFLQGFHPAFGPSLPRCVAEGTFDESFHRQFLAF